MCAQPIQRREQTLPQPPYALKPHPPIHFLLLVNASHSWDERSRWGSHATTSLHVCYDRTGKSCISPLGSVNTGLVHQAFFPCYKVTCKKKKISLTLGLLLLSILRSVTSHRPLHVEQHQEEALGQKGTTRPGKEPRTGISHHPSRLGKECWAIFCESHHAAKQVRFYTRRPRVFLKQVLISTQGNWLQ